MASIWPSLIYLALSFLGLGLQWGASDSGKKTLVHLLAASGIMALLYWGNFFDPLLSKIG